MRYEGSPGGREEECGASPRVTLRMQNAGETLNKMARAANILQVVEGVMEDGKGSSGGAGQHHIPWGSQQSDD